MKKILCHRLSLFLIFITVVIFSLNLITTKAYATPRKECVKDYGPVHCAFVPLDPCPPTGCTDETEGRCIEGCEAPWIEGNCPVGVPCEARDAACKCGNGGVTCFRLLPSPTPTPAPTLTPTPIPSALMCAGLSSPAERTPPSLGNTISLTCNKNASYLSAVTYNFRLIKKASPQDSVPIPVPTAFVQNSTNNTTSYKISREGFGYYLFQCQVCAGAICTDWQAGPL